MAIDQEKYFGIIEELKEKDVSLIAVSKTKPAEDILTLYELGQRDFGENYVQELTEKEAQLPKDIRWHFIGHLQSNKVKYIAPFVHLIHGVDSLKLLREIDKQGKKLNRVINVLLQVHIAQEETKFGFDEQELDAMLAAHELSPLQNIKVCGLMGMASFTNNTEQVRNEFQKLKNTFDVLKPYQMSNVKLQTLSMGMSGDYKIAIEEGSTMVRIGSLIFGERNYAK